MHSVDQLRVELTEKIKRERKRLKSFGTKPKPFDYGYALGAFVHAKGLEAEYNEIHSLRMWIANAFGNHPKKSVRTILRYLKDKEKFLCVKRDAWREKVDEWEGRRPWNKSTSLKTERRRK